MAAGVPETDVFQAADAVLARGERPTVERVRTELGRGSPARVGQLLEQWWERLAQRLKGHTLLPELPGEVAQAFAEAWRLALAHADTAAQGALTEEQNGLFAMRTELTQERKLWEIALAEAQASQTEIATKIAQTELQLDERQTLVDQLGAQCTDLLVQRDRLQAQLEQQRAELETLRAEQRAAQEHIRGIENRAHQQVDEARQELKTLQQERQRDRREQTKRIAALTAQNLTLQSAVRMAEQATAHQAGRVAALEASLIQWRKASGDAKRKSPSADTRASVSQRNRRRKG